MDFTGFHFNGVHSSQFGIYRVSDGSRYQEGLLPTSEDYVTDIPGGDGQYYFGNSYKTKTWNLNLAFDNVTEKNLRDMKRWLASSIPGDIIFDESPYKRYVGKISGEPSLNYICFDQFSKTDNKYIRIYKGEGTVSFICYYPYAFNNYHKALADYSEEEYPNKDEWAEASGMKESLAGYDSYNSATSSIKIFNAGDIETDWKLTFNKPAGAFAERTFQISPTEHFSISIKESSDSDQVPVSGLEASLVEIAGKIEIDTKKNMVTFIRTDGARIPAFFLIKTGSLFKIPVSDNDITMSVSGGALTNAIIEYNYLYY